MSSNWFTGSAIYQINPRTFSKEGTIAAVTSALPDLKDLGFKIMYLCPVFKEDDSNDLAFWSERQKASKTENPKNPYRINNYFDIDDEYGSIDDLKNFVKVAHDLGMKVILDMVYLHIGPNADILKLHPEFAAKNPDGSVKVTTWHFPYLNFEHEGLREYLYCNMVYYIGVIDADGFRCDVGDAVPLDFWREGKRRILTIKPNAIMINEGIKPEYLSVFDANYCFDWHKSLFNLLRGELGASEMIDQYESLREKTPAGRFLLRDMDNHDTVTDWPYRIEAKYGSAAMELIQALNYTIDGIPMVYCGNELSDTARLSMFANRFHMGDFEVTDREAVGKTVERRRRVMTLLNSFRESLDVFCRGEVNWFRTENPSVLAFERKLKSETIAFIGNLSGEAVEFEANTPQSILLSNNIDLSNGRIILGAYGYAIVQGNNIIMV